jgi:hypothetical protein
MAAQPVRVGIGVCTRKEAFEAGQQAAAEALAKLGDVVEPSLILVFSTPRYDLPALVRGVRSLTGSTLLVGCTGSGELVAGDYLGFGGGVGVLALAGGAYRFGVASEANIEGALDPVGQTLARAARDQVGPSPYAAAMLITDSLLGDLQQFVQGVYRVTGPKIAIVGGAAGDEQRFVRSSVFHDGAVMDKAALVLWIASDHPIRVVTRHGWSPIGAPLLVTSAEGTQIAELGGRPAAAAYEEALDLGEELTPENFWGTSINHPFGLLQPDGTHVIRVARAKNPQGTLTIQGCVPPVGSAVQVMGGSTDDLLNVTEEVARTAIEGATNPGVLLTFSCAARAMIFKERAAEESARIQTAAGDIPAFGFYCCAEFARTAGVMGTHNATLTAVAL